jgi:hypothetical protein
MPGHTVYLVVPAKGGWAVNNGADTLSVHAGHAEASERAHAMSDEAADDGETTSVIDVHADKTSTTNNKPL